MFQPYSDCACTQTSLHICDLRTPYDWFYHDTIQNGRVISEKGLFFCLRSKQHLGQQQYINFDYHTSGSSKAESMA